MTGAAAAAGLGDGGLFFERGVFGCMEYSTWHRRPLGGGSLVTERSSEGWVFDDFFAACPGGYDMTRRCCRVRDA